MTKKATRSQPTKHPRQTSSSNSPPQPTPHELDADIAAARGLYASPEARNFFEIAAELFFVVGKYESTAVSWPAVPDRTIVSIAMGVGTEAERAYESFLGPASWETLKGAPLLTLFAYLGRNVRRDVNELTEEMRWIWRRLLADDEIVRRLLKHRVGGLLWLAAMAAGYPDPPPADYPQRRRWPRWFREHVEARATKEWLRRISRSRKLLPDYWLQGVLGEADVKTAREEATGLLGVRLTEELRRLNRQPLGDITVKALSGRLNYHAGRSGRPGLARQAVLRGQRRERERHILTDQLDGVNARVRHAPRLDQAPVVGPRKGATRPLRREEGDPVRQIEATAADPDRMADRVRRVFRLSPAEAKVVHQITCTPDRQTRNQIAQKTGVSLSLVEKTLRKLAGDEAKLLKTLLQL